MLYLGIFAFYLNLGCDKMEYFSYKNGKYFCEDVLVEEIQNKYGSPCFIYSKNSFLSRYKNIETSFSQVNPLIAYSVKGCSNISILNALANVGSGADIVSGGELFRALKANISPSKIVYSGVGKRDDEIEYALDSDILMFNVESLVEAKRISAIATAKNKIAKMAFRVNPDVDAKTHDFTTTGKKDKKFGIPIVYALDYYKEVRDLPGVKLIGIDCHLGSPIYTLDPFKTALGKLFNLVEALKAIDINIEYLDMGGGMAIVYNNESPFSPKDLAELLVPEIKKRDLKLILEPGRYISGNSGILAGKIVFKKETDVKKFLITDFGLTEIIRPPFYDSYHEIIPGNKNNVTTEIVDVVGPICESSDYMALGREVPIMEQGDTIIVRSAGAYCFSMSSNYNSRPRPAEVLIDGSQIKLIRKAESYEDLIANEEI